MSIANLKRPFKTWIGALVGFGGVALVGAWSVSPYTAPILAVHNVLAQPIALAAPARGGVITLPEVTIALSPEARKEASERKARGLSR